jgi:hypothetical protein
MTKKVERPPLTTRGWIINALCIAVGMLARIYSPSFGPYVISPYTGTVLAGLLLTRPRFKETVGIAVVTGIAATITSKAAFPTNWASDVLTYVMLWPLITVKAVEAMKGIVKVLYVYAQTLVVTLVDWFWFFVVIALALGMPASSVVAFLPGIVIGSFIVSPIGAWVLYFAGERVYHRS